MKKELRKLKRCKEREGEKCIGEERVPENGKYEGNERSEMRLMIRVCGGGMGCFVLS